MNENSEQQRIEAGYDAVYASMLKSPTLWRVWKDHAAGPDFPDVFSHISFVTLEQLRHMANELRLSPGKILVDFGCGLGGPALWVANETGANLVGIDLSGVAVSIATQRAEALGLGTRAKFLVASFADTSLDDASVDGIMSEDAIQYAPDKSAVVREAARILRPGGRLAITVFELDPERVAGLPVFGTDPVADYRPLFGAAGLKVDAYEEVPGWPQPMSRAYEALLAARTSLAGEMGESAVAALSGEMTFTLEREPYRRRVLIVATKS